MVLKSAYPGSSRYLIYKIVNIRSVPMTARNVVCTRLHCVCVVLPRALEQKTKKRGVEQKREEE